MNQTPVKSARILPWLILGALAWQEQPGVNAKPVQIYQEEESQFLERLLCGVGEFQEQSTAPEVDGQGVSVVVQRDVYRFRLRPHRGFKVIGHAFRHVFTAKPFR